jgi:hypothetical protein
MVSEYSKCFEGIYYLTKFHDEKVSRDKTIKDVVSKFLSFELEKVMDNVLITKKHKPPNDSLSLISFNHLTTSKYRNYTFCYTITYLSWLACTTAMGSYVYTITSYSDNT